MKLIFQSFFVLMCFSIHGQFKVLDSIILGQSSNWSVDNLGYVYELDRNEIIKYDTTKKQLFRQSVKSLGNIDQIEFINAQRILLFSIDQQQIYLLDNTLSYNGLSIDLTEYGFKNVTHISVSFRPNLIWLYDQFNSNLNLFDLDRKTIMQSVNNFKGIYNIHDDIIYFKEVNTQFYICTKDELIILDLNLNFIDRILRKTISKILVANEKYLEFDGPYVKGIDLTSFQEIMLSNPLGDFDDILFINDYFFIRKGNIIYRLILE